MNVRWLGRVGLEVLRRPFLWPTAALQLRRLTPNRWWRRWPPLPLPDRAWVRFRLQTAYGDPDHEPPPEDVVAWLEWCRQWERLRYPSPR